MRNNIKKIGLCLFLLIFASCSRWYENYGITNKNQLHNPDSISNLIEALKDENPTTRRLAMGCLAKIGTPEAIEQLKNIEKSDPDERVRTTASNMIKNIDYLKNVNKTYVPVKLTVEASEIEVVIQPKFKFFTGHKDKDIVRKLGILPINIKLLNLSDIPFSIESTQCKLITPQDKRIMPIPSEEVNEKLKISDNSAVLPTILLGAPGLIITAISIDNIENTNEKIKSHINKGVINSNNIQKNESIDGYLFFPVDKKLSSLEGWGLEIVIKNITGELHIIGYDFSGKITIRKY